MIGEKNQIRTDRDQIMLAKTVPLPYLEIMTKTYTFIYTEWVCIVDHVDVCVRVCVQITFWNRLLI